MAFSRLLLADLLDDVVQYVRSGDGGRSWGFKNIFFVNKPRDAANDIWKVELRPSSSIASGSLLGSLCGSSLTNSPDKSDAVERWDTKPAHVEEEEEEEPRPFQFMGQGLSETYVVRLSQARQCLPKNAVELFF